MSRPAAWAHRTPEQIAYNWEVKQVAYLNDVARKELAWRLETEEADNDSLAVMTLKAGPKSQRRYAEAGGYYIGWNVESAQGDNPNLHGLGGAVIHLASTPSPDSPTPNGSPRYNFREFRDMLFYRGAVRAIVAEDEAVNSAERSFSLGQTVGLSIVAPEGVYAVWQP